MFFPRARLSNIRALAAIFLAGLVAVPLLVFGAAAPERRRAPGGSGGSDERKDVSAELRAAKADERRAAAEDIAYGRGKATAKQLADALKAETKPGVRHELHRALGKVGGKEAVTALSGDLTAGKRPVDRASAARAIGQSRGGQDAVNNLAKCLKDDPDADVRVNCAISLTLYSGKPVEDALLGAADDPDPKIRWNIALALTRIPQSAPVKKALDLLEKDDNAQVAAKTKSWRARLKK